MPTTAGADWRESARRGALAENALRAAVADVIARNTHEGYSRLLHARYSYVAPSVHRYPYQWFWDTCFHVVMLLRIGEARRAQESLEGLFAMQGDDGFVGHMIFWRRTLPRRWSDVLQSRPTWRALRPHTSALIQPPLAATALRRIFEATGDRAYLARMFPKLQRFHRWLAMHRDFDADGLLTIISPFESGMDWKPSFDPVVGYAGGRPGQHLLLEPLYWRVIAVDFANFVRRYDLARIRARSRFCVKDVAFNTIYALDLEAMARLARALGEDPGEYEARRARVGESILRLMYDDASAAFYDVDAAHGARIPVRTACLFFPLALGEVTQERAERILRKHFDDPKGFALPFAVPSVSASERSFSPGASPFIWRGPTWAFDNWFLFHALRRRGMEERAKRLREALRSAVEKSGFRECYDPFTGAGYGAKRFTWSGLLLDMLDEPAGANSFARESAQTH